MSVCGQNYLNGYFCLFRFGSLSGLASIEGSNVVWTALFSMQVLADQLFEFRVPAQVVKVILVEGPLQEGGIELDGFAKVR